MIKFVLAAVWIVAAAVGAVVYSFQSAQSHGSEGPPAPYFGGLDYIKTDVLSIPLLTNNRVYGYFLARLVYTVEPDVMQKLSLPAEALLIDQVYTYLYGNPEIDFSEQGHARPRQVRTSLRVSINARVGREFVHDVLIEQVDFLSKAEIRDNTIRRRTGEFDTAAEPAAAEAEQQH